MSRHFMFYGFNSRRGGYYRDVKRSDPYDDESKKSYDRLLHETLSKIFFESDLTNDQKKELIRRAPNDQKSILKLVKKREPGLSMIFPPSKKLSLLWIAVLNCLQNSADLLVSLGADVDELCQVASFSHLQWTILHVLLQMYPSAWNERFVDLLTMHVADVDARDANGRTALHFAASRARVRAIKSLLERGADVNAVDNMGSTPLLEATKTSCANELVPLLVNYGADPTVRDNEGRNALHLLTSWDCPLAENHAVDLARLLLEKGVSLDYKAESFEFQPLHWAVYTLKHELVKLFLDYGANVNAQTMNGKFPLYIAVKCRNTLTGGANIDNSQDSAFALLKTLLKHGANIDLKTIKGRTTMHNVCCKGNTEGINILLQVGADILIKDYNGDTAGSLLTPSDSICKLLAIEKARLPPSMVWKVGEIVAAWHPQNLSYYEVCGEEIENTKSASFFKTCTLFDVLTKCECRIAHLMRNIEFERKFKEFDLNFFPIYAADIREAFERVKLHYQYMLLQESLINDAVYHTLPYVVARTVTRFIECEVCEIKRIVQASRHQ